MTYRCFNVEIADHVAHVQLKRGEELNTMVPEFWRELPEIIRDIDANARARVIVISSTGKHFSGGMDLAVFTGGSSAGTAASRATTERGRTRANLRLSVLDIQESFNCLEKARVPVLIAIQGGCVGGAVDMASACDCRYATEDAFFVIQEINIGMTADVGTFPRLCGLIPQGWVRELAYTGRRLPAQTALQIGLVNAVLPDHEAVVAHALATAAEIAAKAPLAVAGSKVMINYAREHDTESALDYIGVWQTGMFAGPHMAETFQAKREGREPVFPDLVPIRRGM